MSVDSELEDRVRRNLCEGSLIPSSTFVAPGAHLSGRVVLGENVSIWPGAVLRGDLQPVTVGDGSNIQDNAVLHVADNLPCQIGKRCTIGHSAIVHACSVGDECLVGMGAILLDGCEIAPRCVIGAGTLVTQRMKIPEGSMVFGSPARIVRPLNAAEIAAIVVSAEKYQIVARLHRERLTS